MMGICCYEECFEIDFREQEVYAVGPATYFGDWEFRNAMLRSALRAGGDVSEPGKRHYKLGEFAIVGEAAVLAMRTQLRGLNNL